MKALLAFVLLISFLAGGLGAISRINENVGLAKTAYLRGDYIAAVAAYEYLLGDLEVRDDQIRLNLAHTYFRLGEMQQAQQQYALLAGQATRHVRTIALLQLGAIAAHNQKYKQALSYFRQTLVLEPGNEAARYNYELLKKLLDKRPDLANEGEDQPDLPQEGNAAEEQHGERKQSEQEATQPRKKPDSEGDQEAEADTPEHDEDGEQEEQAAGQEPNRQAGGIGIRPENQQRQEASGSDPGDTHGLNPDNQFDPGRAERSRSNEALTEEEQRAQTRNNRLQQLNINPEKARLMLDAMRSAEQQYIQQLPKKATRKPDPSKPDW